MSVFIVRSTVKQECVVDVDSAVEKMFAAIAAAKPAGVSYASYKLDDGVSYIAVLRLEEGVENPLPQIEAFREFQAALGGWMAEPPVPMTASVVGSYS